MLLGNRHWLLWISLRKFIPFMHMFPLSIYIAEPFFLLCKYFSHVYILWFNLA